MIYAAWHCDSLAHQMHRWLKQYLAGRSRKRKSGEMLRSGSSGGSAAAEGFLGGSDAMDIDD